MSKKSAQSTRPCSIYLLVLDPPVPVPRDPHDRGCGPPILDPCDKSHGPLPGLFWGEGPPAAKTYPQEWRLRVRGNVPMHRVIRKVPNQGARLGDCKSTPAVGPCAERRFLLAANGPRQKGPEQV